VTTHYPCPSCGTVYPLPETLPADHPIRCATCGTVFTRAAADAPADAFADLGGPDPTPARERPRPAPAPAGNRGLLIGLAAGGGGLVLASVGVALAVVLGGGKPKPAATKPADFAVAPRKATAKGEGASPAPKSRPKPKEKPPETPRLPPSPDGWGQDFDEALKTAKAEKKDVLVLFNGSDWCPWCQRLTQEVFVTDDFRERAHLLFVPVHIDFPRRTGKGRVKDAARNTRLRDRLGADGFPTVVLTDSDGRPYAVTGYEEGGAAAYVASLSQLADRRSERDELFAAVTAAEGPARLAAARKALGFLKEHALRRFYPKELASWAAMAEEIDPKNARGQAEEFFAAQWLGEVEAAPEGDAAGLAKLAASLRDWQKVRKFKDPDLAAVLHLVAARSLSEAGRQEDALAVLRAGRAYTPKDERLARVLRADTAALGLGSGTGFVVSTDGYVLTNNHVVGDGKVMVRLGEAMVPAEVVARDKKRDMALIRVKPPAGTTFVPVKPVAADLDRGQPVAALGYPLGDVVGSGLKLTTGVVSGKAEGGTGNMLLLDAKVNPGNSGGPLCDAHGNVVAMVTAKSVSGRNIDSYGMAVPATDLDEFLRKHLKGYEPPEPRPEKLEWNEVDKLVSPSVLMVLSPGGSKKRDEDDDE
jgi:S1-C subfamily serine protease